MWSLASHTGFIYFYCPRTDTPTTHLCQGTSTHLCCSSQLQFVDGCVWWPLLMVSSSCPLPVLPWQGHSRWQSMSQLTGVSGGCTRLTAVTAAQAGTLLPGHDALPCFLPSLLWDLQRLSIQCWQQAAIIARLGRTQLSAPQIPSFTVFHWFCWAAGKIAMLWDTTPA